MAKARRVFENVRRLKEAGAAKQRPKLTAEARQKGLIFGSELVPTSPGGLLTNRPPDNREVAEAEAPAALRRSTGGEDRFEISAYVSWAKWEHLRPTLETAKQTAESLAEGGDEDLRPGVMVGEWAMQSKAAKVGQGQSGPVYRYMLKRAGVVLLIANREDYTETYANVRIVIESLPLIVNDARAVWAEVVEQIEGLGGTVDLAKPGRVDVCVDLAGVNVSEFTERFRCGQFVTRARREGGYGNFELYGVGRRDTGLRIGVGVMLRVYDKLEEVQGDPTKLAAMREHRWNGETPETATRVEFQIRREEIKSMGVDTMEDWFKKRADVCAYLTAEWFRFTDEKPNRTSGHQASARLAASWVNVCAKFAEWCGQAHRAIVRVRSVRVDFKQLRAQVKGLVTSLYAYGEKFVRDKSKLFSFAFDVFEQAVIESNENDLWKRAARKRAEFMASMPDGVSGGVDHGEKPRSVRDWFGGSLVRPGSPVLVHVL